MAKTATLYRMKTAEHMCPFGLRTKDLLRRKGYKIDDNPLTTRAEVDSIKSKLAVSTTPQVIIDGKRIGGFEEVSAFLGEPVKEKGATSYFPVIALFVIALFLSAALSYIDKLPFNIEAFIMRFVGLAMIMLGLLKLQNISSFVNSFLGYDLLARKYVPYAFVYPYAEVIGGLLMVSSLLPIVSIPLMLIIGGIGGVSVFKAVYIDKRELKCACVGGDTNVPLGAVSFSENAVMFAAAFWMLIS